METDVHTNGASPTFQPVPTRRRTVRATLIALTLALVSCEGDRPTAPRASPRTLVAASAVSVPTRRKLYDEEMLELSQRVPGFAGYVINVRGELERLFARSTALTAAQKTELAVYEESNRWNDVVASPLTIRERIVDFDAVTLLEWRSALEGRLSTLGVRDFASDFDEEQNLIAFEVLTTSDSSRIAEDLLAHGVPRKAFRVTVSRLRTTSFQTLKDNVPPLRGGMELSPVPGEKCTVGPPIKMYSGPAIILVATTNSHCTDVFNANSGMSFYQTGQFIGTEVVDMAALSTLPGCPNGQVCRYADMAVLEVTTGLWALNTIANTGAPHSLVYPVTAMETAPYPLTIVDQDTVVGFEFLTQLPRGATVRKQGRTTGTTSGQITATCVNRFGADLAVMLLCQNSVGAQAGPGDSGAPVYTWVANPPYLGGNATIRGILWGGDVDPFTLRTVRYWYSPARGMANEAPLFDQ